jgi:hypothetical protein
MIVTSGARKGAAHSVQEAVHVLTLCHFAGLQDERAINHVLTFLLPLFPIFIEAHM